MSAAQPTYFFYTTMLQQVLILLSLFQKTYFYFHILLCKHCLHPSFYHQPLCLPLRHWVTEFICVCLCMCVFVCGRVYTNIQLCNTRGTPADRGSRNLGQCVCLWFRQQQRGEGREHHQACNTSYHQVGCALPGVVHTEVVGEEEGRRWASGSMLGDKGWIHTDFFPCIKTCLGTHWSVFFFFFSFAS